jgi:hypothetical protein
MPESTERKHRYHAEATALEGFLRHPIRQQIERQAHAKVPEIGGYLSQHADSFRLEGIVSYDAAHTQVAGHPETEKQGGGFKTLATSVVENLNVLNVITADRIVAQVSTEHPASGDGYMPTVTFLGTHFYNLRIAGRLVDVDLDLDIPGEVKGDRPYTKHPGLLERIGTQLGILHGNKDLPDDIRQRYPKQPVVPHEKEGAAGEAINYSLVRSIEFPSNRKTPPAFPGTCFGHVIDIPHFGKVYLATVCIEQRDPGKGKDLHMETLIKLTMLDIRMGCIANGQMMMGNTINNGGSGPPVGR